MKYLSVCSGIEAASVAWHPLGWRPVAFSEVEPFPSAVLAHRWPEVPNLGDMTQFKTWPDYAINLLVGGTPCQSFSVAGLRKGLADPRGNLALTFLAIAARYRPQWVLWENVPGVLSDKTGGFAALLGGLGQLGYGWAYRVLDAQYAGVPQRRRRVFVVGHLGDWRRAAAVLFERHCLQGHPTPRREAGQNVAPTISALTKGGGRLGTDFDCDGGLITDGFRETGQGWWKEGEFALRASFAGKPENLVTHSLRGEGFDASEDGTGRGTPLVPVAIQAGALRENPESGPDGVGVRDDGIAYTLEARAEVQAVAFSCKDHGADAGGTSPTLRAMGHSGSHANAGGQVAVALAIRGRDGVPQIEMGDEVANTILTPNGGRGGIGVGAMMQGTAVRRLTPKECARLQGFPDTYLDILFRGKPAADGPKYKALGNSMAVPCMRWIGQRIDLVNTL